MPPTAQTSFTIEKQENSGSEDIDSVQGSPYNGRAPHRVTFSSNTPDYKVL